MLLRLGLVTVTGSWRSRWADKEARGAASAQSRFRSAEKVNRLRRRGGPARGKGLSEEKQKERRDSNLLTQENQAETEKGKTPIYAHEHKGIGPT